MFKRLILLLVVLLSGFAFSLEAQTKADQLRYQRVRAAYADSETELLDLLEKHDISVNKLRIYIRAFKDEGELEIWAKNESDDRYQLIETYAICQKSGSLGPKRKQGDYQVPEGFYRIDRFNPASSYYLSLGINYPNKSDRILSDKAKPGGDIFIHGECVTIGCLPMTNDIIKRIYVLCLEAMEAGQGNIPVTIFPARLAAEAYTKLLSNENPSEEVRLLWRNLKAGFDAFNDTKKLPYVQFMKDGTHVVIEAD